MTRRRQQAGNGPKQQRAVATRALIVSVARASFGEAGYHVTGIADVVEQASLTRGALYHHFADKKELFEAVFRQVLEEVHRSVVKSVAIFEGDLWEHLLAAFTSYLELVSESPVVQRILLIDGPAVLGWEPWRTIQASYGLGAIRARLDELMAKDLVIPLNAAVVANLVQASLNDAALAVAHADDPRAVLADSKAAVLALAGGLRRGPAEVSARKMPVARRRKPS